MDRGLPSVFAQRRNSTPRGNDVGNDGQKSSPILRGGLLKGSDFRSVTDESLAQEICRHLEWAQGIRDDADRKEVTTADPSPEQALSASPSKATHNQFAALRSENQILRQRLTQSEATLTRKALHNGGQAGKSPTVSTKRDQPEDMQSTSSQAQQLLANELASNQTEERSGAAKRRKRRRSVHFSRRSKSEDAKLLLHPRVEHNASPKATSRKVKLEKYAAYSHKVVPLLSANRDAATKGKIDSEENTTVHALKKHVQEVASLEADLITKVKRSGGIDHRAVASIEANLRRREKNMHGMDRSSSLPVLQRKATPPLQENDTMPTSNPEVRGLVNDTPVSVLQAKNVQPVQEMARKQLRGTQERKKAKEAPLPKVAKRNSVKKRDSEEWLQSLKQKKHEETSAAALRDLCIAMRRGSRGSLRSMEGDDSAGCKEIRVERPDQDEAPNEVVLPRANTSNLQLLSPRNARQKNLSPKSSSPKSSPKSLSPSHASPKNLSPRNASPRRASPRNVNMQLPSPKNDSRRNNLSPVYRERPAPVRIMSSEDNGTVDHLAKDFVTGIFRRLQDDGEVHKDSLPWALQLCGFPKANPDWIYEELRNVSSYDSIDLTEFLLFVKGYETHEHRAAKQLFNQFDDDHSGSLDLQELPALFQEMGISPLTHVVRDIVKDVSPASPDSLTFEECWQVMIHLRKNEGFTSSEVEYFEALFRKFDADDSGSLESKELSRILVYLGHAMEEERVLSILKEVDVDNNGSLDIREFIVCMRKVREHDVENMQEVFDECDEDGSGGIEGEELVIVLRQLGYFPEIDDIADACTDINKSIDDELDFDQLWEFLQAYRGREGFSVADMTEIKEVFETADKVKGSDGEIEVLELGRLFALLGCIVPCDQIQCFVANVDIDGSGYLDLHEFIKVVRQSYHFSCQAAQKVFVQQYVGNKKPPILEMVTSLVPGAHVKDIERIVARLLELKEENGGLDQFDFVSAVNTLKKKTARQAKRNFGFGVKEVNILRATFTKYDVDRSGLLSDAQAIAFFESEYPEVATCIENRPVLMEIMKNAHVRGAIDFRTFLRLVRKCQDLADQTKIRREREAILKTGFSGIEVKEFREIFLMATIEQEKESVTLPKLLRILKGLVPPTQTNKDAIKRVFIEVVDGKEEAEFSCFLLIFRQLLDLNIGKINLHAARRVAEVEEAAIATSLEKDGSRSPSKQNHPTFNDHIDVHPTTFNDVTVVETKFGSHSPSQSHSEIPW